MLLCAFFFFLSHHQPLCLVRFKPVAKVDAMSGENYSGAAVQHTANAAEQTVIAQSQHHQQFLGQYHLLFQPLPM